MKAKYIKLGFAVLILAVILSVLIILIIPAMRERARDKNNKAVIEAVTSQVINCPNDELIELYTDMYEQTASKLEETDSSPIKPENSIIMFDDSRLREKLREMYSPYFTDNGYERFEPSFLSRDYIYSTAQGYSIVMDRIEITQSDTIKSNYSFNAYISYGRAGVEQKEIIVDGSAQFYEEEGRLSFIRFMNQELLRELWGKGPSIID